ncbi:hypothetical protein BGZ65_003484, partial [Modicella reniformis]
MSAAAAAAAAMAGIVTQTADALETATCSEKTWHVGDTGGGDQVGYAKVGKGFQ